MRARDSGACGGRLRALLRCGAFVVAGGVTGAGIGFVVGGFCARHLVTQQSWHPLLPSAQAVSVLLSVTGAGILSGAIAGAWLVWRDGRSGRCSGRRSSGLVSTHVRPSLSSNRLPMMYPPELLVPMREELTSAGFQELTTAAEVDQWVADKASGLLVINSVCGCAAGMARPGARAAVQSANKPARLATVFAGQDREATQQARSHFSQIAPSSPSMALFKDGEVVDFLPRHRIEGRSADEVRDDLVAMFDKHFGG